MKRKLSLLLSACLLACALSACSGYASVSPNAATTGRGSYETATAGSRYNGNVSTSGSGRVNGTNRTLTETGRAAAGSAETTARNTDAMGAGTRG
jgi:hypothetical protein